MKRPIVVLILAGLLLSGCAQATLVSGAAPVRVGGAVAVPPVIGWSRFGQGNTEVWTVDGPMLEQMRFMVGLTDGDRAIIPPADADPLTALRGVDRDRAPRFREGMILPEVKEFFEGVLAFAEAKRPQVTHVRPMAFAGHQGFAFDFSFTSREGLDFLGFARGTIHEGKLYLVTYQGTRLYYFDKHRQDAERVMDGVTLL